MNLNNAQAVIIGNRVLANLEALGFKNRGVKDGVKEKHLYEVRNTDMTGIIYRSMFCRSH